MKIDCYTHIVPPKLLEAKFTSTGKVPLYDKVKNALEPFPTLHDLEYRFRIMDKHPDVVQVLTLGGFSPDNITAPDDETELAMRINDEMAELVFKYPDRFVAAAAVLPMSDMDAALKELDRAVNELRLKGVMMRIPTRGRPVDEAEFMPFYEKMCQYNLPVWFHPESSPKNPDYPTESESKYFIWHLWGFPYETSVAMTRLVFSGVLEKYPTLKIITHHCGAMVPYFAERIVNHYNGSEMRHKTKFKQGLTEPHIDYFRRFYNDTAIQGNTPALMCAYNFFGAEHILYGTDMPYDPQLGDYGTRQTIEAIEQMDIPDSDKKKIFEDNARSIMRLPI